MLLKRIITAFIICSLLIITLAPKHPIYAMESSRQGDSFTSALQSSIPIQPTITSHLHNRVRTILGIGGVTFWDIAIMPWTNNFDLLFSAIDELHEVMMEHDTRYRILRANMLDLRTIYNIGASYIDQLINTMQFHVTGDRRYLQQETRIVGSYGYLNVVQAPSVQNFTTYRGRRYWWETSDFFGGAQTVEIPLLFFQRIVHLEMWQPVEGGRHTGFIIDGRDWDVFIVGIEDHWHGPLQQHGLLAVHAGGGRVFLGASSFRPAWTNSLGVHFPAKSTIEWWYPHMQLGVELPPEIRPIPIAPINFWYDIDNLINSIMEETGIECETEDIIIIIPDADDWEPIFKERPRSYFIRRITNDGPCPVDPSNCCQCPPDIEGLIRSIMEEQLDDESPESWISRLIRGFSFPTFTFPAFSFPDWSFPDIPGWNFVSNFFENIFDNLITPLIDALLRLIEGLFSFDWIPSAITDFTLDLQPIRDAMPNFVEYFPFSLPFALYNTFRVIAGQVPMEVIGLTPQEAQVVLAHNQYMGITQFSSEAPRFEINLPPPFYYTFVFDFNDYSIFVSAIRWGILIMFVVGMIKTTPKLLRW